VNENFSQAHGKVARSSVPSQRELEAELRAIFHSQKPHHKCVVKQIKETKCAMCSEPTTGAEGEKLLTTVMFLVGELNVSRSHLF
jgi:hypothetical protein